LRAQINPHFIFNCLNSIHHFMHHHGAQRTGDYLIKFSQLIRYALETSSSHMVPLSEDLEALKAYIELEQLRMQSSFEYTIDVSGIMDLNNIQIPPMMIQPFVENSIWHGLNSKGNGGLIAIRLNKRDDMMHCVIEDNGIPTTGKNIRATMPTVRKTSMGMALIRERLAMVNRLYNVKADFTIEDRINDAISQEGTRVNILLPFEE
jgi:LytS/YehU family sensor histidine kinase